jgi:hypothetical protein
MLRATAIGLVLASTSAAALAQPSTLGVPQGERPKPWEEGAFTLPAPPRDADLVEVRTSGASTFRFLVDKRSVSTGDDGVVRYTVVAVSSEGARNITHEGLRCATHERRVYALGRSDGWAPSQSSEWRLFPITSPAYYGVLYRDIFCPNSRAVGSAREGVDALARGMHPRMIGTMP